MKSYRLELFWTEKIKIVQYLIQTTSSFLERVSSPLIHTQWEKSIRAAIQHDKRTSFYMGVSLRLSSLFPFPPIPDSEIEEDLNLVRDLYPVTSLPKELDSIYIHSAKDLEWEREENSKLFQDWKSTLIQWERTLSGVDEFQELRYRYFSMRGVKSLVYAINSSSFRTLCIWEREMKPLIQES